MSYVDSAFSCCVVAQGQLSINQNSKVMLVTEEGRKAESSVRFRVTCGTTGTSTDIVAEDCDDALEWVKAIQVVGASRTVCCSIVLMFDLFYIII